MTFKTSLDGLAKGATIAVSLLFVTIIVSLQIILNDKPGGEVTVIVVALMLLLVYCGAYLYRPLRYVLNSHELVIHRPLNPVIIPREDIEGVQLVDSTELKGTIWIFGLGGLFGYYGQFLNSRIGSMTWYATRRNKMVLLHTRDNSKIVLSPDEPEVFVSQFLF